MKLYAQKNHILRNTNILLSFPMMQRHAITRNTSIRCYRNKWWKKNHNLVSVGNDDLENVNVSASKATEGINERIKKGEEEDNIRGALNN